MKNLRSFKMRLKFIHYSAIAISLAWKELEWMVGVGGGGFRGVIGYYTTHHNFLYLFSWLCVCKRQSWAHRSYKLSERSKAMSDPWFSERKKMSVERWANCQKKEFAHRSKRSLNLKKRAFWAVRSLERCSHVKFFTTGELGLPQPLNRRRLWTPRQWK